MSKQLLHHAPSYAGQGFRKALISGCALLCLGLLATIFFLFQASSHDQNAYMTLMLESNPQAQSKAKRSAYTARQERRLVKKELTFLSNQQRLELQLQAQHSTLQLHQHEKGTELIEDMHEVCCYMQEELFYMLPEGKKVNTPQLGAVPMQMIRVCQAEKASYSYQTEKCLAENVHIARYLSPGHSLLNIELKGLSPFMQGRAQTVEFSLGGGQLNFKANQLAATWKTSGENL